MEETKKIVDNASVQDAEVSQEKNAEMTSAEETVVQTDPKIQMYENALRKIFALKPDEDLGNIDQRITALEEKNAAVVQAAKNSIISSAIKSLQGYDTKLLNKVIDLNSVEVDDNGSITGLDTAVKTAETEYPAVKLPKESRTPYVPVNPQTEASRAVTMNDLIRRK